MPLNIERFGWREGANSSLFTLFDAHILVSQSRYVCHALLHDAS